MRSRLQQQWGWGLTSGALALPIFAAWTAAAAIARPLPPTPNTQRPTPPPQVDFNREVRPILSEHCVSCHGFDSEKRQAGLRLDVAEGLTRKGAGGKPIVVPGKPAMSELMQRVLAQNGLAMPPANTGRRLTPAEIDVLRRWIAQGARFEAHWAYVEPRLPQLPTVKNRAWVHNPIDAFVLARLEREGLQPSPEAEPAVLLRRVTLDLTGLPPTPQEVDAFLNECETENRERSELHPPAKPYTPRVERGTPPERQRGTPPEQREAHSRANGAYERAVDRLLASPQFGERWARPWLDLARYADSHGFQRDDLREIWPYRDWVIRALNADMPFDQFTIDQLAGDLVPNATEAQMVATGFHRCTTTNVEAGSEPEETRVNQVLDRVNTTAAVWLGSTLECAQCHDHKYDPFTRKDYYRLFAYFNNTALEADRADPKVPGSIRFLGPSLTLADPARDGERKRVTAEQQRLDRELETRRRELLPTMPAWEKEFQAGGKPNAPADITRILGLAPARRTPAQVRKLADFRVGLDSAASALVKQKAEIVGKLDALQPPSTLIMQELPQPRPTAIFLRGDYRRRGEGVEPGTPAALTRGPSGPPNRLALARWLIAPENPLTARVTVNRWWAELFGRGIVPTLEDFGVKGEPPSHPELLDYLAVAFATGAGGPETGVRARTRGTFPASGPNGAASPTHPYPRTLAQAKGWSTKALLKLIVMSATYRQSSRVTPYALLRDPENRLLARGPRYRMDAEMIRDNALAVAGLLSLKQGGPPVRPYQPEGLWRKVGGAPVEYVMSPGEERHRRGIYVVWKRATPYPSFVNFDATSRLTCTVKRSRSNTPLQALTLLNDPVYVEAAMALARQALGLKAESQRDRLRLVFLRVLGRQPIETELSTLERLLEGQRAAYRSTPDAARQLIAPFPHVAGTTDKELAAWYAVATALLNLDETITKG